jgi:hypothetical protein
LAVEGLGDAGTEARCVAAAAAEVPGVTGAADVTDVAGDPAVAQPDSAIAAAATSTAARRIRAALSASPRNAALSRAGIVIRTLESA